jgi:hypothetical protein
MQTVEQKYPNANARRKADEAVDALSEDEPMHAFIALWIDTYYHVSKTLPRGQVK